MKILIVAVENHSAQMVEVETDTAQLRALKPAFKELVQSLLAEYKIAVILEEWSRDETTIARQIASRSESPILWRNIDMTDHERRKAGVFDELADRPQRLVWGDGPMPELIQDRTHADDLREDFFVSRILEENESSGKVLVLLGKCHVAQVAEKLRAAGHTVNLRP